MLEDGCVVGEGLELERIAGGVEQKHRPLLPHRTGEAQYGLDDERHAGGAQSRRERVERVDVEQQAEVRHRHVVAVDGVVVGDAAAGSEMRDELMAAEVPVHPGVGLPPLRAAEYPPVEVTRCVEVVDGHGKVKSRPHGPILSVPTGPIRPVGKDRTEGIGSVEEVPPDRPAERMVRCVIGLVVCGTGLAAIIHAELGLAPWDVLHQGVSRRSGIPIGTVIILFGGVVLLAWIPLRVRPGVGTILNAILIGVTVDLLGPQLPAVDALGVRIALLVLGTVAFGFGTGLYIGAGLGPGPRDGLMTGLVRRGLSVRVARTGLEVGVLVGGFMLGGSAGIGTAVFTFGIGPIVQYFLPRLSMRAEPARCPPEARVVT